MSFAKRMQLQLPEGVLVTLIWPESITLDSLEMFEKIISIQLDSIRKSIARKVAAMPQEPQNTTVSAIILEGQ